MRLVTKMALVLFLISFLACKQGSEGANHQVEEIELPSATSEAQITEVVNRVNNAMIDRDEVALKRLCSDQLSYGHSSGLVQDKTEFIDDIMNGPFRFLSIDKPEPTFYLDGNTAIVRYILTADATRDGEPVAIKIGNVQVYKKALDGHWKLLARQAYKL